MFGRARESDRISLSMWEDMSASLLQKCRVRLLWSDWKSVDPKRIWHLQSFSRAELNGKISLHGFVMFFITDPTFRSVLSPSLRPNSLSLWSLTSLWVMLGICVHIWCLPFWRDDMLHISLGVFMPIYHVALYVIKALNGWSTWKALIHRLFVCKTLWVLHHSLTPFFLF